MPWRGLLRGLIAHQVDLLIRMRGVHHSAFNLIGEMRVFDAHDWLKLHGHRQALDDRHAVLIGPRLDGVQQHAAMMQFEFEVDLADRRRTAASDPVASSFQR